MRKLYILLLVLCACTARDRSCSACGDKCDETTKGKENFKCIIDCYAGPACEEKETEEEP